MNLEVLHPHARARRVELPRTIKTLDPREKLILDTHARRRRLLRNRGACAGVDEGVPHHAFEAVVGIGPAEIVETLC